MTDQPKWLDLERDRMLAEAPDDVLARSFWPGKPIRRSKVSLDGIFLIAAAIFALVTIAATLIDPAALAHMVGV